MTSHGHMTNQEKKFRGSGDEDLLTLSPIYCDVIARVRNDVLSLNNPKFNDYIDVIYPEKLEI